MTAENPKMRLIYDARAKEAKDRFSELKDAEATGKLIAPIQTLQNWGGSLTSGRRRRSVQFVKGTPSWEGFRESDVREVNSHETNAERIARSYPSGPAIRPS